MSKKSKTQVPNPVLKIKRFKSETVNTRKEGQRVGIIGRSGSGKTTVALDLMEANAHIPAWLVVSASESSNNTYGKHMVNNLTIHDTLDEEILSKLMQRQKKLCKAWKIPETDPPEYEFDPSVGVILDDFAGTDNKVFIGNGFKWLHYVSRHDKTLVIEIIQDYTIIPKKMRSNWSFVFLFRQDNLKQRAILHQEFFGMLTTSQFKEVFELATANYGALVVDLLNPSNNITDRVFYYKASTKKKDFICGDTAAIKHQKKLFNKNWDAPNAPEPEEIPPTSQTSCLVELVDYDDVNS